MTKMQMVLSGSKDWALRYAGSNPFILLSLLGSVLAYSVLFRNANILSVSGFLKACPVCICFCYILLLLCLQYDGSVYSCHVVLAMVAEIQHVSRTTWRAHERRTKATYRHCACAHF